MVEQRVGLAAAEEVERLRSRVAELERSESYFRQLADSSPNMIFVNRGGRVIYANRRCSEVTGYSVDELTAPEFDFRCLIAPESMPQVQEAFARHMAGKPVEPYDYTVVTRDGRRIEAMHTSRLVDIDGEAAILGIITDVTARKNAERALRASEQQYRLLIDTLPDAVVASSLTMEILTANQRAADMLGWPSLDALLDAGVRAIDTVAPHHRRRAEEALARVIDDGHVEIEVEMLRRDGGEFPAHVTATLMTDANGAPVGVTTVTRDLSSQRAAEAERRALEQQIQHTQRLESLGVLAGGIAHDFNNLLVGILGNASLARLEPNLSPQVRQALDQIEVASRRAADLTKQMLAYSGKGSFARRVVFVRQLVHEMAGLLKVSLPKSIAIEYGFSDASLVINADPGQVQQIVMNLITNAADAMLPAGGVIRLELDTCEGDEVAARGPFIGQPALRGSYVCMAVTDTGAGMDAETVGRIFEPFFTTKFTGRGLGLAAVLGIVRGHEGALSVRSTPGEGTRFRVLFPVAPAEMARQEEASKQELPAPPVDAESTALVLVVDDEELVLSLAERILTSHGYDVLLARNGQEAVAIVEQRGEALNVVLLDLTMPQMDGLTACEKILALQPDLPVILSSGYTQAEVTTRLRTGSVTGFIQKPYGPVVLLRAVQAAVAPGEEN